jgi:hypothetical protein
VRPPRPDATPPDPGDPGDVIEVVDGFERTRRGVVVRDDEGKPVPRMVKVCGVCTAEAAEGGV